MKKDWQDEASFSDFIIAMLGSASSMRLYRQNLWEIVKEKRKVNENAFRQGLYRLNKKGIVNINGNEISLRVDYKHRPQYATNILRNSLPGKKDKILIAFDISEDKKKVRDWLRNQLKFWNFKMIQKSLWRGTGPLPKDFKDRLKDLEVINQVKVFNIRDK